MKELLENLGLTPGAPVVVAMSGGVDSSVCAAWLKREGFHVIGITLQLYDQGKVALAKGSCCAGQDIYDARRVAEQYGFPHYVLDFESVFRQEVIEDFVDTYLRGETPLPCVRCNQRVKFQDLLRAARDLGAQALVTGHYVQRLPGPHGPEMHRAVDLQKDQSYFLFATTKAQLDFLRFPLGGLRKEETRRLAHEMALPLAQKPDSQDICFVAGEKYSDVVKKRRPESLRPGPIVHVDGTVLGEHEGILHFTIGQRKGLKLGGQATPLFVVELCPETQRVIVGPQEALACHALHLHEVNWLGQETVPEQPVQVKIRSTHAPVDAFLTLSLQDRTAFLRFKEPQMGVARGQACVFFGQTRVLGGGWIASKPP